MNKKIILGLTTAVLLASSLLACNSQGQMQQGNKSSYKQGKMMKHGQRHKGGFMFMKMVMKLDLSDEQRAKVKAIVKKSMQSMKKPSDAFTDSSFDKQEFIKLAKERRDSKIERKAEMIENIYVVLNSSQKKDLKTMLDIKEVMKKNMMNSKNCNKKKCNAKR
jgi:Spy/CpxP family protein refolding chaperone